MECSESKNSTKSYFLSQSDGLGKCDSCASSMEYCELCSDESTWELYSKVVDQSLQTCQDQNCFFCPGDTWQQCKSGFVLKDGVCTGTLEAITFLDLQWEMQGWIDWDSPTDDLCKVWAKGYFLSSEGTCTGNQFVWLLEWTLNWAQCSSETSWDLCDNEYFLTSQGTCTQTCEDDETKQVELLDSTYFDVLESRYFYRSPTT